MTSLRLAHAVLPFKRFESHGRGRNAGLSFVINFLLIASLRVGLKASDGCAPEVAVLHSPRHLSRLIISLNLGDESFGREHQAGDGRGVLQRVARNFRRVDDARGD
jgi:hypothetical protein